MFTRLRKAARKNLRRLQYSLRRDKEPYKSRWQMEYDLLTRPYNQPGRIRIMGWDIEFVDGISLYHMLKINVVERYNDFYATKPSPRILDCGANIGISVLRYKQLYPAARIIAFEADPDLCKVLRRNLDRNNLQDVDVVEAAVWCRDEPVEFVKVDDSQSGFIGGDEHHDRSRIKRVRGVSLLQYLDVQIDLLKLDIEGSEFEVLPSIRDKLHNVEQIILEVHHSVDRTDRLRDIFDVLSEARFNTLVNAKWAPPSHKPYVRPVDAMFDEPFLIWAWR
jgi:FkbM family methyltransferase